MTAIYLASASPRRQQLLGQLGVVFKQLIVEVDETRQADEPVAAYVRRLALEKARAGWYRAAAEQWPMRPTLGGDTVVVIDHEVLGKPLDRRDGLAMLTRLAGREHQVFSGVAVFDGTREGVRVQISQVTLSALSEAQCRAYWDSGEPADKAGGYAIQGLGASFVAALQGSHSGVMGLPLFETAELLGEFGIDIIATAALSQNQNQDRARH